MSYILDALKKSDQERQRHSTPGIRTVHATAREPLGRRKLWPYILILALLLNAGLLLWWMQPWQAGKPQVAVQEPPKQETVVALNRQAGQTVAEPVKETAQATRQVPPNVPNREETVRSGSLAPEVAPSQPAGAPVNIRAKTASEPPKNDDPKTAQEKQRPKIEARAVSEPAAIKPKPAPPGKFPETGLSDDKKSGVPKPADLGASLIAALKANPGPSAPDPAKARPREIPGAFVGDEPKQPGNKPDIAPNAEDSSIPGMQASARQHSSVGIASERKSSAGSDSGSESGIPLLNELPLDVQANVPKLSFSMFVFSQNPADRMVSINGKVMREGQEVAAGLKLERITRNEAIFNYRGHRFRKDAF